MYALTCRRYPRASWAMVQKQGGIWVAMVILVVVAMVVVVVVAMVILVMVATAILALVAIVVVEVVLAAIARVVIVAFVHSFTISKHSLINFGHDKRALYMYLQKFCISYLFFGI